MKDSDVGMPCEGCGVGISYASDNPAECGHGSGYKCCNCALDAGVYNGEQYEQYACAHCRHRLEANAYPGRRRAAGEGGGERVRSNRQQSASARRQQQQNVRPDDSDEDGEDRYFRVSEEARAEGQLRTGGQVESRAAEIVSDAEMRREQILNQAAQDAERMRAEAAAAVQQALRSAARQAAVRGLGVQAGSRSAVPAPRGSSSGHGSIRLLFYGQLDSKTEGFHSDRRLGAGGTGAVYKCDPVPGIGNGVRLAVKRFEVAEHQSTFLQEALIMGACEHPSLLPILGMSIDPGKPPCIVMPLMAGGSLEDHVKNTTSTLSWAQLLSICCQVARGLVFLHTEDIALHKPVILHRDVKPANILLEAVGNTYIHARLADPGMARAAPELGRGGQTHVSTMQVVGTNGCVDPAVQSTGRYDESSDGYSLGVTLLVALTGCLPFEHDHEEPLLATRLYGVLQGQEDPLRAANQAAGWSSEVAHEVVRVCKGLLHPVRRQRPSIAAAIQPLEIVLAAHYGGADARRRGGDVGPAGRHSGRHGGSAASDGAGRVGMAETPAAAFSAGRGGDGSGVGGGAEGRGAEGSQGTERQCIVCFSEPRQVRFSCGHAVVCHHCAGQVTVCACGAKCVCVLVCVLVCVRVLGVAISIPCSNLSWKYAAAWRVQETVKSCVCVCVCARARKSTPAANHCLHLLAASRISPSRARL